MKGMNDMIRQAQIMQRKLAETQEELKTRTVDATVGGGMIKVTCTGGQELAAIVIDPAALEGGDVEMLQDLVLAAVNEGLKQAKAMVEQEMSKITGGIKIPGMF
ncbi:MAG: YbaB/EbfC family nucleoid-associated protein [Desulfovibrionaceae bacterium]